MNLEKICLSAAILSFTSLNGLEITKSKQFDIFVNPSFQTASFSLSHTSNKSIDIEKKFKKAVEYAKEGQICKGGNYSIYPRYKYVNNSRIADGYSSHINFRCEFDNVKKYEELLSKIKKLNSKLTQNQIQYKNTHKQKDEANKQLEQEAYDYAKKYRNYLNKQFKNCNIKKIDFTENNAIGMQHRLYAEKSSMKDSISTSPIKDKLKYSLTVRYTYSCENED